MKKILAVFLLLAGIAAAQTYGSFSGVVTGPTGIPVANASVTICHAGAVIIGTDCAQKATIYSSATGGVLANPLTTNANGEFTFYAPPGDYTYSWNGNLYRASVMMAANPVLAGLTIGSGPAMTQAPVFLVSIAELSANGSGTVPGFGLYTFPVPITITRIGTSIPGGSAVPAGCTTLPSVYLYTTAPVVGTSVSLANGTKTADSGAISVTIAANTPFSFVFAGGLGCTTYPGQETGSFEYQMQ